MPEPTSFKPFIAPKIKMKEFTVKAVVMGAILGSLFGAATVYLALKAGLNGFCIYSHCSYCNHTRKKIFKDNHS